MKTDLAPREGGQRTRWFLWQKGDSLYRRAFLATASPTSRIGEPRKCSWHQSRAWARVRNVIGSISGPVVTIKISLIIQ